MIDERKESYLYWFSTLKVFSRKQLREIWKQLPEPEAFFWIDRGKLGEIGEKLAVKKNQMENFLQERDLLIKRSGGCTGVEKGLLQDLLLLRKRGILFYSVYHPDYPKRCHVIPDAPLWLYVKGELPKEDGVSLAIIGARECSEYGRYMAGRFGKELAEAGISVISGMARGIDGTAQRACIGNGGHSFGILGSGVDVCYPKSNTDLYNSLSKKGGIISEYPPGTPARGILFPARNRIISGLSDGVLIIEAREKSGTLITVDMALEQGKEIYVLPGRVTDSLSMGCNRLIRQGATMILSPEDLLEELSGILRKSGIQNSAQVEKGPKGRGGIIWKHLDVTPKTLECLHEELIRFGQAMEISLIAQELMYLCVDGWAQQTMGGGYIRNLG